MPYIGNTPADKFLTLAKQNFSTSATTSYTLDSAVSSTQDIALFINNVRQSPVDAYSVSGTALTLTSATAGTDEMYCVYLGKTVGTVSPPNDSVGLDQLSATGTASSSVFLRGDNAWASAGLTGWSIGGTSNSLIPSATDQGVYLGVSSATASNLLDDYEEGVWTPSYASSGATITNGSTNGGAYTKIGRVVIFSGSVGTGGSMSGGTAANGVTVSLPFTAASNGTGENMRAMVDIKPWLSAYTWGGDTATAGRVNDGNAYFTLYYQDSVDSYLIPLRFDDLADSASNPRNLAYFAGVMMTA